MSYAIGVSSSETQILRQSSSNETLIRTMPSSDAVKMSCVRSIPSAVYRRDLIRRNCGSRLSFTTDNHCGCHAGMVTICPCQVRKFLAHQSSPTLRGAATPPAMTWKRYVLVVAVSVSVIDKYVKSVTPVCRGNSHSSRVWTMSRRLIVIKLSAS